MATFDVMCDFTFMNARGLFSDMQHEYFACVLISLSHCNLNHTISSIAYKQEESIDTNDIGYTWVLFFPFSFLFLPGDKKKTGICLRPT